MLTGTRSPRREPPAFHLVSRPCPRCPEGLLRGRHGGHAVLPSRAVTGDFRGRHARGHRRGAGRQEVRAARPEARLGVVGGTSGGAQWGVTSGESWRAEPPGRKRRAWGEAGFGDLPGRRWPRVGQSTAEQASSLSVTVATEARGGGQDPPHARQGGSRSDVGSLSRRRQRGPARQHVLFGARTMWRGPGETQRLQGVREPPEMVGGRPLGCGLQGRNGWSSDTQPAPGLCDSSPRRAGGGPGRGGQGGYTCKPHGAAQGSGAPVGRVRDPGCVWGGLSPDVPGRGPS